MDSKVTACLVLEQGSESALKAMDCLDKSELPVDVFLVDNTRDDGTVNTIRWKYPGVNVLPQKHDRGFAGGQNAAIPYLAGDYHLILHPDVTFDAQLLGSMVDYMDEHPNTVMLSPAGVDENGALLRVPRRVPAIRFLLGQLFRNFGGPAGGWWQEYTMGNQVVRQPISVDNTDSGCLLIRTDVLRSVRGFDSLMTGSLADADFCIRVRDYGHITYHPELQAVHAANASGKSAVKNILRQIVSFFRYLIRHGLEW